MSRHHYAPAWLNHPLAWSLAIASIVLGLGFQLNRLEDLAYAEQQRVWVMEQAATARSQIESELNGSLGTLGAMKALLGVSGEPDSQLLQQAGPRFIDDGEAVSGIQLAPGGYVRFAYPASSPAETRGGILGADLRSIHGQTEAVQRAIDTGQMLVLGPDPAEIIALQPVYTGPLSTRDFWGFVSVTLDSQTFFRGIEGLGNKGITFAIRGRDAAGTAGRTFFGDPALFRQDSVTSPVELPTGSWELAAQPAGGWVASRPLSGSFLFLTLLIAVVVALLTFVARSRSMEARRLAEEDSLTGALTRRAFTRQAKVLLERARREGRPVSLVAIDVDHFKRVNDTHGHSAGDSVLGALSQWMVWTVRRCDLVVRLGGDEFAILIPDSDIHQAAGLAERIRAGAPHLDIAGEPGVVITVSCGVAECTDGDLDRLMNDADAALYSAKHQGRNSVQIADGSVVRLAPAGPWPAPMLADQPDPPRR